MKIFGFAPLLLAISSASATTQIRGVAPAEDKQIAANARKLVEDSKEFQRQLKHQGGGKEAYDGGAGAGCSCSGDAVKKISNAHAEAVQGVPMVTMAMLEAHKDDIWDSANGGSYEPLKNYGYVIEIVEGLVKWVNCILLQIDCGQCGLGGKGKGHDSSDTDEAVTLPEEGRKLMTPYHGISNFECCCDVNAIKKLVIDHINDFFLKALLSPGGSDFVAMNLETLFHSLISAVKILAAPYADEFRYECEEPKYVGIPTPYR